MAVLVDTEGGAGCVRRWCGDAIIVGVAERRGNYGWVVVI